MDPSDSQVPKELEESLVLTEIQDHQELLEMLETKELKVPVDPWEVQDVQEHQGHEERQVKMELKETLDPQDQWEKVVAEDAMGKLVNLENVVIMENSVNVDHEDKLDKQEHED